MAVIHGGISQLTNGMFALKCIRELCPYLPRLSLARKICYAGSQVNFFKLQWSPSSDQHTFTFLGESGACRSR